MAALGRQIIWFGLVGVIGFMVDAAVLYVLVFNVGTGHLVSRLPSFLAAATVTWALNRRFTFAAADRRAPVRQWLRFLAANALGALVNYATFAALIVKGEPFLTQPVLAVAAGSVAGMVFNFTTSRWLVFRPR